MYIAFNNDTKRVVYVGNKKPSVGGDATVAEVETLPEKYDYLIAENIRLVEERLDDEIINSYYTCDL
jgi:hypothetical protein